MRFTDPKRIGIEPATAKPRLTAQAGSSKTVAQRVPTAPRLGNYPRGFVQKAAPELRARIPARGGDDPGLAEIYVAIHAFSLDHLE